MQREGCFPKSGVSGHHRRSEGVRSPRQGTMTGSWSSISRAETSRRSRPSGDARTPACTARIRFSRGRSSDAGIRRPLLTKSKSLAGRHKAGHVFFTDSVFNDDMGHYLEVISEMKQRGVSIPWTAFFKPEGLDEDVVKLMKETGLQSAEIGADATTDTTLRRLGKSFRFEDIVDCNDLFGRHDIGTAHFYMFGSPGETQRDSAGGHGEHQEPEERRFRSSIWVCAFFRAPLLPGWRNAKDCCPMSATCWSRSTTLLRVSIESGWKGH